jgi:hypothetical protein
MSLDAATRTFLEEIADDPSPDGWCGAWNTLLTILFPSEQGYSVCPRQRNGADGDLIIEVAKVTSPESPSQRLKFRILLVVEIKDYQHWDRKKQQLMQQLRHQTDDAFSRTARGKVFWIATIGPHWLYGEKGHGQGMMPLIEWHHATFDDSSCRDLEQLVELVGSLDE